ncbi:ribonuclease M5 [Marinicrinis lubricantis]|uniref:Ribonuclease M5 n=1 Tax=Marinicrinis lubricantis TaxID=2086470 RepID=A0ABW1IR12_9BACL
MIKEVIVVEGKDDTVAVKRAVNADTIETGGSAIDEHVLHTIRLAQERRGVIIFTDPDHPGERIRSIISEHVPGCKHAFLNVQEAKAKGKVGVEHASPEAIRRALEHVHTAEPHLEDDSPSAITMADLMEARLVMHPEAARRREEMGKLLRIGVCNGKQFLKRCSQFRISKEEFEAAVRQIETKE